jgi:hypothetical protein
MISNVQSRWIAAPIEVVGPLLDRLADPEDGTWAPPPWPRLRMDRGLEVGSQGGHAPIRYRVTGYQPGRWLRCQFSDRMGVDGYHEFTVRELDGGTEVSHLLVGGLHGRMRLVWPLVIRWLHEALLGDLLDGWERRATGDVRRPYRWSPWVRLVIRARSTRLGGRRRGDVAPAGRDGSTGSQPTVSSQSRR